MLQYCCNTTTISKVPHPLSICPRGSNIFISFCRQNSILLSILCCFVEWPVKYSPFFKLLPLLSVGEVLDGIQTAEGFLLQTCYSPNYQNLYYQYCGFWSNRTLPYFPLSSSVRPPFVRHRRDILTFLDILTVYTMKTIYFLNAYHPGWQSWPP